MKKVICGKTENPLVYEGCFGTNNADHFEYRWACGCQISVNWEYGLKFVSCGEHKSSPIMNRPIEHIVPKTINITGNTFQPYIQTGDCIWTDSGFVHGKLRRRIEEALRQNAGTGQILNIALYLGVKLD